MKNCKACDFSNLDDAEFCAECGAALRAEVCPKCSTETIEGAKFCRKCGCNLTKENKCTGCGIVLAIADEFCNECGAMGSAFAKPGMAGAATFNATAFAPAKSAAASVPKLNKVRIKNMVVSWVFAALFLFMALVSLGSVASIKMDFKGIAIKPRITGIDLLCAPFRAIDPLTMEEIEKDFATFTKNNFNIDAGSGMSKQIKEVNRILTKYGVLKLTISKESLTSNQAKLNIALMCTFYYLFLLTAVAMFILFLVRAIKVTLRKRNLTYRFGSLLAAITASIIALVCLSAGTLPAAAAILIYTFTIVSIVGIAVTDCIVEKKKISVKKMTSQAVSVVLALSLFSLALLPSTVMKFTGVGTEGIKSSTITEKNQYNDYTAGFDYDSDYGIILGQQNFKDIAESIVKNVSSDNTAVKALLQPSLMFGYKDTADFKPLGVVAAVFSLVALAFVGLGLAGVVATSLGAINGSKAGKFTHLFIIAALVGFAFMLASCIMVTVGNNAIFKDFELLKNFKTSIGAASIVGMATTIVMLVQHLIIRGLTKEKKLLA